MKHNLLLLLFLSITFSISAQKKAELQSPNGEIKVSLSISDKIYYTISYNNDEVTKAQEEAFNLILDHKSVVASNVTDYKVLTSMVMDLPVEEYGAKRQYATHQTQVEKYLCNGADDFARILKAVNVDSLEALKQILPRLKGENSGVVAAILDDYTPMHKQVFAKSLQLIDKGEMTLDELAHVMDEAGGSVPFRV